MNTNFLYHSLTPRYQKTPREILQKFIINIYRSLRLTPKISNFPNDRERENESKDENDRQLQHKYPFPLPFSQIQPIPWLFLPSLRLNNKSSGRYREQLLVIEILCQGTTKRKVILKLYIIPLFSYSPFLYRSLSLDSLTLGPSQSLC